MKKVEKLYVKAEVHDLSKVDLPTFGSPAIQHLNDIFDISDLLIVDFWLVD